MNYLKNNWFKIVITIAILAATGAISYYFVIYLPREKSQQSLTANQLECSQLESQVKDNYAKDLYSDGLVSYMFSSNHYNQKLQKCIVSISSDWNTPNAYSREDVLDAVEDKIILRCNERVFNDVETDTCTDENGTISYAQFTTLENQYMSQ